MRCLIAVISLLISFSSLAAQLEVRIDKQAPLALTYADIRAKFATSRFSTSLPWLKEQNEFSGFKVSELLQYLKLDKVTSVTFSALNDYRSTTSIEDIIQYEPIIAYKINGKTLKIRDKGPYWLVFNLDKHPQISTDQYFDKMVWQINRITINSH